MAAFLRDGNGMNRKRKLISLALLNELGNDDIEFAAISVIQNTTAVVLRAVADATVGPEIDETNTPRRGAPPKAKEDRKPSKVKLAQTLRTKRYIYVKDARISRLYTDEDFKEHFRMNRKVFQKLCELVGPLLPSRTLSIEKKVLATLWVLGSQESFAEVAKRFEFSKGTLYRVFMGVSEALTELRKDFIKWPSEEQVKSIANDFEDKFSIPGVGGVLSGAHVWIPMPKEHGKSYKNKKGLYCLQMQLVSNADLQFTDVVTGWPGSVHNSRVFRNSPLMESLENGALPPDYHLLGDSSYQLSPYLLIPYPEKPKMPRSENKYNRAHGMVMKQGKRAIGLLRGKFRRLRYMDMTTIASIPYLIFAACVLHNFIIRESGIDRGDIDMTEGPIIMKRGKAVKKQLAAAAAAAAAKIKKDDSEGSTLDMEVEEVVDSEETEVESDSSSLDDRVVWKHDYYETAVEKRFQIARKLR